MNPGGNLTGTRFPAPEMAVKKLDIFLQLKPDAKTLVVPYLKGYPNVPEQLRALIKKSDESDITILEAPVSSPLELQQILTTYEQDTDRPIDAVFLLGEPLSVLPDFYTVYNGFAREHQIPLVGSGANKEGLKSFLNVVPNEKDATSQIAFIANKILQGEDPATIPVLSPEPEIIVNLTRAEELGLTFPEALLAQVGFISQ